MDKMTLTLNSPLTDEQWDAITDVDFDNTNEIHFHTKHGKEVYFVKQKKGKWVLGKNMPNYSTVPYFPTTLYCSECRNEAYWDTDYGQQEFDWCPYCGSNNGEETEDAVH